MKRSARDDSPKPFRVQRHRLGKIRSMRPEGDYGFIEAEDFRLDVFFHKSVWQAEVDGRIREPLVGTFVEFELDDECLEKEKKLRAKLVRYTTRPMGRKLMARDTPHLINKHHPKARRKRPSWRGAPPKDADLGKSGEQIDAPDPDLDGQA